MKLTKKEAIEIAIELWEWLAETGEPFKSMWPGWKKYGGMTSGCPFCEYAEHAWDCLPAKQQQEQEVCDLCPYKQAQETGCGTGPYSKWGNAKADANRKKYAAQFLQELKELRNQK